MGSFRSSGGIPSPQIGRRWVAGVCNSWSDDEYLRFQRTNKPQVDETAGSIECLGIQMATVRPPTLSNTGCFGITTGVDGELHNRSTRNHGNDLITNSKISSFVTSNAWQNGHTSRTLLLKPLQYEQRDDEELTISSIGTDILIS